MSAARTGLAKATRTGLVCSPPKWATATCALETPQSQLSAVEARATPACGSGPLSGGDRRLRGWRLTQQGRYPGGSSQQPERDLQIPPKPHQRQHRPAGAGLALTASREQRLAARHKSKKRCAAAGLKSSGGQVAMRAWACETQKRPRGIPCPATIVVAA